MPSSKPSNYLELLKANLAASPFVNEAFAVSYASNLLKVEDAKPKGKVGKPPDPIGTLAYWKDGIYKKVTHGDPKKDWKWIGNPDPTHPVGTKLWPSGDVKLNKAAKEELAAKGVDPAAYAAEWTKKNKNKLSGASSAPVAEPPPPADDGVKKTAPQPVSPDEAPTMADAKAEAFWLSTAWDAGDEVVVASDGSGLEKKPNQSTSSEASKQVIDWMDDRYGKGWRELLSYDSKYRLKHLVPGFTTWQPFDAQSAAKEFSHDIENKLLGPSATFMAIPVFDKEFGIGWRKLLSGTAVAKIKYEDPDFDEDPEATAHKIKKEKEFKSAVESVLSVMKNLSPTEFANTVGGLAKLYGEDWLNKYLANNTLAAGAPVFHDFLIDVDEIKALAKITAYTPDAAKKMADKWGKDWVAKYKAIFPAFTEPPLFIPSVVSPADALKAKQAAAEAEVKAKVEAAIAGKDVVGGVDAVVALFSVSGNGGVGTSSLTNPQAPTEQAAVNLLKDKYGADFFDQWLAAKLPEVDEKVADQFNGTAKYTLHQAIEKLGYAPNSLEAYALAAAFTDKTGNLYQIATIKQLRSSVPGATLPLLYCKGALEKAVKKALDAGVLVQHQGYTQLAVVDIADEHFQESDPSLAVFAAFKRYGVAPPSPGTTPFWNILNDLPVSFQLQAKSKFGHAEDEGGWKKKAADMGGFGIDQGEMKKLAKEVDDFVGLYAQASKDPNADVSVVAKDAGFMASMKAGYGSNWLDKYLGLKLALVSEVEKYLADMKVAGVSQLSDESPFAAKMAYKFGEDWKERYSEAKANNAKVLAFLSGVEAPKKKKTKLFPGLPKAFPVGTNHQELYSWAIGFAKAINDKFNFTLAATPWNTLNAVALNPQLIDELAEHFGPNWFHKVGDAYLLKKYNENNNSEWLKKLFGNDWKQKALKLANGEVAIGDLKAAIISQNPGQAHLDPAEDIAEPPAPVATPNVQQAPLPPPEQMTDEQVADAVQAVLSKVPDLPGFLHKALNGEDATSDAFINTYGYGWAYKWNKKYHPGVNPPYADYSPAKHIKVRKALVAALLGPTLATALPSSLATIEAFVPYLLNKPEVGDMFAKHFGPDWLKKFGAQQWAYPSISNAGAALPTWVVGQMGTPAVATTVAATTPATTVATASQPISKPASVIGSHLKYTLGVPVFTFKELATAIHDNPAIDAKMIKFAGPGWKDQYVQSKWGGTWDETATKVGWVPPFPSLKSHGKTILQAVQAYAQALGIEPSAVKTTPEHAKKFSAKYGAAWWSKYQKAKVANPSLVAPPVSYPALGSDVSFPPASAMVVSGDASSLGGNKPKKFLTGNGQKFLFKTDSGFAARAHAGEAASRIAARIFPPGSFVPVRVMVVGGERGSVQPMVDNQGTLEKTDFSKMTKEQKASLVKERVLDWVIGNHDAKAGNFLLKNDGQIVGIDKEQAFKFLVDNTPEQLSTKFKPNNSPPIYNAFFQAYASFQIDLDPNDALEVIEKIEAVPDSEWLAMIAPYLTAVTMEKGLDPADKEAIQQRILARKDAVRSDFEKFFTFLKQARGVIGSNDKFTFASAPVASVELKKGKKKKLGPGEAVISPPMAGIPLPELKYLNAGEGLGGAGKKALYTDNQGKKYLFKFATPKGGTQEQPFRVAAQTSFAAIATKIKSEHLPLAGAKLDGKLGVVQPFVDAQPFNIKSFGALTASEKEDIASEHLLDWMMSQHDSHPGNWLKLTNGKLISIDKEQGFKYIADDKLSIDYHPNGAYGEQEPVYNSFWRAFAEGEMDFDPKVLDSYFPKFLGISGEDLEAALRPYAIAQFPDDLIAQENFIAKIRARRNTMKRDFEKFITGLYEQREGTKGTFTFSGGWVEDPTAVKKKAKKKEPTAPEPPKTKKIQVTWKEAVAEAGIKVSDFKPPDPAKVMLKVHTGGQDKLEQFVAQKQIKTLGPVKTGSNYSMIPVEVAQLEKLAYEKEVPIEPPATPVSAKTASYGPSPVNPSYIAQGPQYRLVTDNFNELKSVAAEKIPLVGKHFSVGGAAVENHDLNVKRIIDTDGKEKIWVHFKMRKPFWKNISGGQVWNFEFPVGTYDDAAGAWKMNNTGSNSAGGIAWDNGENMMHLANSGSEFAFMGSVNIKLVVKPGMNVEEEIRKLLDKAKPGLSNDVLRSPTEEEKEVLKLSKLLWAYAPDRDRVLAAEESTSGTKALKVRTLQRLKTELAAAGVTQADVDGTYRVQGMDGYSTFVKPGRWKEEFTQADGKPMLPFFFTGVSSPAKVVNMFRTGLMGIYARSLTGADNNGSSAPSDISSGGADVVLGRPVPMKAVERQDSIGSWQGNVCGPIKLVVVPSELDRLDTVLHNGDAYGNMGGGGGGGSSYWGSRQPLEAHLKKLNKGTPHTDEIVFRKGVAPDRIARILVDSPMRSQVIDSFKKAGVHEVNGVPVEDFVVNVGDTNDCYDKYVKPMGY